LTLPHSHMLDRAFVLAPLAEIAPDRVIQGRRIDEALAALDTRGLEKVHAPQWPANSGDIGMGEWIKLQCADGVTISAWLAKPHGPPKGGIVVLQEIFGV